MALPQPWSLSSLREHTLWALQAAMSDTDNAGAARCAERLHAVLPHQRLADNIVLVAYGGGKDSSYMLAFVRALQLIVFDRHGTTFKLRAVTNRHAGMPRAVMENIDRAYRALAIAGDPDCEALLVDGSEVKPFRRDEPLAPQVVARNRLDLLMTGHRTFGEARPTFCNACNLSMVNSFGLAASHGSDVNVIITGDSRGEQRAYYLWVNRLALRFGRREKRAGEAGFRGFLKTTNDIAHAYFTDIYGPDADDEVTERRVAHDVPSALRFFSIFDDTHYASSNHWQLLTGYLGFQFDELAFSFTESDCANPTLMAHLRGLKCERLYGRSYGEGLEEYVRFAAWLMQQKEFPARLIETMRERYAGADAAERMRAMANGFAKDAFGLSEEQLVCMVYSPLAGHGERLHEYLEREHPSLAPQVHDAHALLGSQTTPAGLAERRLAAGLERVSGLKLERLRTLYRSPTISLAPDDGKANLVGAILAGDPHKQIIQTRRAPGGPVVREQLSGR